MYIIRRSQDLPFVTREGTLEAIVGLGFEKTLFCTAPKSGACLGVVTVCVSLYCFVITSSPSQWVSNQASTRAYHFCNDSLFLNVRLHKHNVLFVLVPQRNMASARDYSADARLGDRLEWSINRPCKLLRRLTTAREAAAAPLFKSGISSNNDYSCDECLFFPCYERVV